MGSPLKELEKGLKELKWFATHRKNNTKQADLKSSQVLNHQPKSTHGGTHGSSCICSRGWPCWASMGEEALGPALCPSVGECKGREAGVGWWVGEHSHRSRGRKDGIANFWGVGPEK